MPDRVKCPECSAWPHVKCENCPTCEGQRTILDRRKPTPNDRAVERIKLGCDAINVDVGGDDCGLSWRCLDIINEEASRG